MTLTFTQENGLYVAEFEATAPFSIHLERPKGGFINMLQRSVDSGTFVAVKNFNPNYNATQVIDADCGQGAVYPKWIRLESAVEPSVAEVTFEDEQSGGGAGTESTMEYLDVSGVDFVNGGTKEGNLLLYSFMVKCNHTILGDNAVVPIGQLYIAGTSNVTSVHALAFDFSAKCIISSVIESVNVTLKELLLQTGWTEEMLAAIPRITKEQFYSLEA